MVSFGEGRPPEDRVYAYTGTAVEPQRMRSVRQQALVVSCRRSNATDDNLGLERWHNSVDATNSVG